MQYSRRTFCALFGALLLVVGSHAHAAERFTVAENASPMVSMIGGYGFAAPKAEPVQPLDVDLLDRAIHRYYEIVQAGGWPHIEDGEALELGEADPRVPLLRERLTITGDYLGVPGSDTAGETFDGLLENAVRRFQTRHGLEVDGVVGAKSLAALNVPAEQKLAKLLINRERMLELEAGEALRVVVNVPEYRLRVLDNGGERLAMDVVVGTQWSADAGRSRMRSSTWCSTPTGTYRGGSPTREILPKVQADPTYLVEERMEVVRDGTSVDPFGVDWQGITRRNFPFRLRQLPGPDNALGAVSSCSRTATTCTCTTHRSKTSSRMRAARFQPRLRAPSRPACARGCVAGGAQRVEPLGRGPRVGAHRQLLRTLRCTDSGADRVPYGAG